MAEVGEKETGYLILDTGNWRIGKLRNLSTPEPWNRFALDRIDRIDRIPFFLMGRTLAIRAYPLPPANKITLWNCYIIVNSVGEDVVSILHNSLAFQLKVLGLNPSRFRRAAPP